MFLKFLGRKSEKKDRPSFGETTNAHGIDLQMNSCPSCGDEYRVASSHCLACNIPLVSGKEKLERVMAAEEALRGRSMDISPADDLVSIRKGPLKDMKYLQKLLASERVPAVLAGDESTCGKGCCGPELYLQIKKQDMSLADAILARDFIKSTALDGHDLSNAAAVFDHLAVETVCPACGCRFSPTVGACPECGLCFE